MFLIVFDFAEFPAVQIQIQKQLFLQSMSFL
jgi:hypothetical protein